MLRNRRTYNLFMTRPVRWRPLGSLVVDTRYTGAGISTFLPVTEKHLRVALSDTVRWAPVITTLRRCALYPQTLQREEKHVHVSSTAPYFDQPYRT